MNVSEIMTREVLSAAPDCPLDEAIHLLETRGFRHLPIVDDGRLVGILSDRDIALATGWMLAKNRNTIDGDIPRRVDEVMTRRVHSLPESAHATEAAIKILDHRISALPVLDGDILMGVLTTTDLLRVAAQEDGGDWKIREGSEVAGWMTEEVKTVSPEMLLLDAVGLCTEAGVRHLPVVEGSHVVGMISDRDLRFGLGQEIVSDMVAQGEGRLELVQTPISSLMTSEVISLSRDQALLVAVELMLEHGFSALPVLDRGRLVGILTQTDVLRCCC